MTKKGPHNEALFIKLELELELEAQLIAKI